MYRIGIDLGGTNIAAGIVNENFEIIRFYVTPYEQTDYYLTGTVGTMSGANTLQWVFLLLNVIPIGFTIFAFVDCCRQKIQRVNQLLLRSAGCGWHGIC